MTTNIEIYGLLLNCIKSMIDKVVADSKKKLQRKSLSSSLTHNSQSSDNIALDDQRKTFKLIQTQEFVSKPAEVMASVVMNLNVNSFQGMRFGSFSLFVKKCYYRSLVRPEYKLLAKKKESKKQVAIIFRVNFFDIFNFCLLVKQLRKSCSIIWKKPIWKKPPKRKHTMQVEQADKIKIPRSDFFQFDYCCPLHIPSSCSSKFLPSNNPIPNKKSLVAQTKSPVKKQSVYKMSQAIEMFSQLPLSSQETNSIKSQDSVQSKSTQYLSFNFIVPTQCAETEMTQILEENEQENEYKHKELDDVEHVRFFIVNKKFNC